MARTQRHSHWCGVLAMVGTATLTAALAHPACAQTSPAPEVSEDPEAGSTWDQFIGKRKTQLMLRSSFFERSKPNENGPAAEAWGVGGWLKSDTGELFNVFSAGAAIYFVGDAYGPNDGGGNFILEDGQRGYSTLGEAWGRLRYGEHSLTVGRQALGFAWSLDGIYRTYNRFDGSFIGRRDVRAMLPLDFESAVVQGKFAGGSVRYYGGWAWNMRQINQSGFDNLASGALLPGDSDGMGFLGAQWKINNDMMLQGSYHGVRDLLDMGWVDFDYVYRMGDGKYVRLDNQVLWQGPNGSNYINAHNTWNWNANLEARFVPWWIAYGIVGVTDDGDEIRAPYSLGPSYLVQRIGENSKAGERTWIIGSTFDFEKLGARGLSFDINYGQRSDRHLANDSSRPLAKWEELSLDLIYVLPKDVGWLAGSRFRLRWASVWEKGDQYANGTITNLDQRQKDIRLDFQLPLTLR